MKRFILSTSIALLLLRCILIYFIDSDVYEKLRIALLNEKLKKGICQASPLSQTSCLEGFHSVLNHYSPKMIAY